MTIMRRTTHCQAASARITTATATQPVSFEPRVGHPRRLRMCQDTTSLYRFTESKMQIAEAEIISSKARYLPLVLTGFLILWTATVYRFATYGDKWAIYPALAVFPATILVHVWVIVASHARVRALWYALVHLALQFVIWLGCLMLISKDAL